MSTKPTELKYMFLPKKKKTLSMGILVICYREKRKEWKLYRSWVIGEGKEGIRCKGLKVLLGKTEHCGPRKSGEGKNVYFHLVPSECIGLFATGMDGSKVSGHRFKSKATPISISIAIAIAISASFSCRWSQSQHQKARQDSSAFSY